MFRHGRNRRWRPMHLASASNLFDGMGPKPHAIKA